MVGMTNGDKENKDLNNEDYIDEKQLSYQELVKLMMAIKCMPPSTTKLDILLNTKEQFVELDDYKETGKYIETCNKLAKEIADEIIKDDYEKAAEGYKMYTSMDKKRISKLFAVVVIIMLIIGLNSKIVKYYIAQKHMDISSFSSAIKTYKKLGNYKDSKKMLLEAYYNKGLALEKDNEFIKAEEIFLELNDYKDSEERIINITKKIIGQSEIGDTVKVGRYKWILLDKQDKQVLLMKKAEVKSVPYHTILEDITWKESSLRTYLNNQFIDEAFNLKERDRIMVTEVMNSNNRLYGTDAGENTKDYIYLLSIEEVEKYNSYFPKILGNSWLRSPGYGKNSASFFTENKKIMYYGYAVDEDTFCVHPVFWLDISEEY